MRLRDADSRCLRPPVPRQGNLGVCGGQRHGCGMSGFGGIGREDDDGNPVRVNGPEFRDEDGRLTDG